MAQHRAEDVIKMVRLLCWRHRLNYDKSGLSELQDQLNETRSKDQIRLGEKYLESLRTNCNKNSDDPTRNVGASSDYLNRLLNELEVHNWRGLMGLFEAAASYFDHEKIPEHLLRKGQICIYHTKEHEGEILSHVSFAQSKVKPECVFRSYEITKLEELRQDLTNQLADNSVLIWCINEEQSKELLHAEILQDLPESGRVIPVITRGSEFDKPDYLPYMEASRQLGGWRGILVALLQLEEAFEKALKTIGEEEAKPSSKTNIHTIHNSGTLFLGDNHQFNSEKTIMGDYHEHKIINKTNDDGKGNS